VVIGPREQSGASFVEAMRKEGSFVGRFGEMRYMIQNWIRQRDVILNSARCNDGKVYAKAFPGRAAILIKMLNLTAQDIVAVFEKPQSMKIGHYVPGTRIPILSDDALLKTIPSPRRILNLAWHIRPEIVSYLTALDSEIQVVDVLRTSEYP
jgi:hypothetical protein